MDKQILAVCEIADYKVRFVVAEFFHTSLNILKVEQVETPGFDGRFVLDEEAIIKTIQQAILNASKNLQVSIERVLLVIPSLNMQKYTQLSDIYINDEESVILDEQLKHAYQELLNSTISPDKEVVFVNVARYLVNGVPFRKIPSNEIIRSLKMESDIYVADKTLAHQLANCVEKAGCEILDVVLDSWALAKESAIIEQSFKNVMIAIKLDRHATQLNLYNHGKIISSEWLESGYQQWVDAISERLKLPNEVSKRLLFYNCQLDSENYSSDPIYLWAIKDENKTCNQQEIMDIVLPLIEGWRLQLHKMCELIITTRSTKIVISGEGALLEGIADYVEAQLKVETKVYVPETLGARDPSLVVALGSFYAYQDLDDWQKKKQQSLNSNEFQNMIIVKKNKEPTMELAAVKKIKSFLQTKKD